MADEPKTLPQIKQEVDELTQKAKSPQGSTIEEREKSRTESVAQALSLSAQMQSLLSKAEYSQLTGTIALGQAGLMAAAEKLTQATQSIPGASLAGSQVGQMMKGYRERQEARRQGGVGGADQGSGGGVGGGSGGAGGTGSVSGPSGGGISPSGGGGISPSGGGTGIIDRARFKAELDANPALRQKIMIIAANENNDPRAQQAIMETMMNRAAMRGKSLASEATWVTEHGYYDDRKGRHRGIQAYNNPNTRQGLETRLNAAVGGSNLANYGTGNASGSFVEGRIRQGRYSRTAQFGGESFVTEGPGYQKWRQSLPTRRPETTKGGEFSGGGATGSYDPQKMDERAKGNADWGKERYSIAALPKKQGANEALIAAGREASKYLPQGWKAMATSGNRPGDPRFHGKGIAVDWRLYDEHGRALPDYQSPQHFRAYEQFAQDSHRALQRINPDLAKKHRWGGYFAGPIGKGGTYGALDLMHQDLGLHGQMAAGSWEKGLNVEWAKKWGISSSRGMSRGGTQGQEAVERAHEEEKRMMEGLDKRKQELERKEWPGEKEFKGAQKPLDNVLPQQQHETKRSDGQKIGGDGVFKPPPPETSIVKAYGQMQGTGFSVRDSQHFITAGHIVGDAKRIPITYKGERAHAEVVYRNEKLDYAILKLSPEDATKFKEKGLTSLPLSSAELEKGTSLTSHGFPGRTGKYSTVSGKYIETQKDSFIGGTHHGDFYNIRPDTGEHGRRLDVKLEGVSGGPVVTQEGNVVGLVSGGSDIGYLSSPIRGIMKDVPKGILPEEIKEKPPEQAVPERKQWPGELPYKGPQVGLETTAPPPQTQQRQLWPGEQPSAPAEARKDQPIAPPPKEQPRGQPSPKQADGAPSPHAEKAKEQARGSRMHIPGESLAGVNPELRGRLERMYQAAPASAKAGFYVISGRRSTELQAKLYARYKAGKGGIAARPGFSKHEQGLATDIRDPSGWFHKHAREYGLQFPMGRRDWPHMQLAPGAAPTPEEHPDTRPHEIKKGALREQTKETPGHPPPKPERPHKIKHPLHPEHHHPHHPRPGPHWATTHHAKASASTQTRVQHSHRTRHAVDDNFSRSSSPNADYG